MKKTILLLTMFMSLNIGYSGSITKRLSTKADEVYICVSKTGHKYHSDRDCRGLARCTHEIRKISKDQAIKMGYSACKICY
jgi:hypothetical protein